jgi:hypothetical protein
VTVAKLPLLKVQPFENVSSLRARHSCMALTHPSTPNNTSTYSPTVGHFTDEGARGLAKGLQGWSLSRSQSRDWRWLRGLGHFSLLFFYGFPIFFQVLLFLLYLLFFFTRLARIKARRGQPQMAISVMNRTHRP